MNNQYTQERAISETLTAQGWSLSVDSGPVVEIEDGENFPVVKFKVTVRKDGKGVLATPYSLGIVHVKIPAKVKPTMFLGLTPDEESALRTLQNKPDAKLVNKSLWCSLLTKLAKWQKLAPSLADVMYCLVSDGAVALDGETFAEWAGNHGYDPDSRKAEAIYRACDETGRKLSRVADVEALREMFQGY